jgi:hypothetical protein
MPEIAKLFTPEQHPYNSTMTMMPQTGLQLRGDEEGWSGNGPEGLEQV